MLKSKTSKFVVSLLAATQLLAPMAAFAEDMELLAEKPVVAEVKSNDVPNRIITTIKNDPSTSMAFNWFTTSKFDDAKVVVSKSEDMSEPMEFTAEATEVTNRYLERDENGFLIFADVAYDGDGNIEKDENGEPKINGYYTDENQSGPEWTSGDKVGQAGLVDVVEHAYKAEATDLEPGTTYYYQVGSASGEMSEVGKFKTAGKADESFTFIQYTDTQNAYWNENVRNEATFAADTIARAVEEVGTDNVDFILHTGDFVETAEVEDEWVDLMEQSKATHLNYAFVSASGNHDEYTMKQFGEYPDPDITQFNEHVNVNSANDAISGGSYYSFDYNGVHFTVLNSNDNKADDTDNPDEKAFGKAQLEWARKDIEEARANGAKWVILAYHKPIFSKSYHSLQDSDVQAVREEFMQQIDELDVDLALQGHDHVLSATYPLNFAPTEENFSNGVIADAETIEKDGVDYYVDPKATVFVLPNTGGTKAYDDIYSKGVDHVHKVRPALDWMTAEDVDYYNSLFAFGNQPQETEAFAESHSNWRDSSVQNFATYTVEGNSLHVKIYQVSGDILAGEERKVELVYEFGITKDAAENTEEETTEANKEETSAEESAESKNEETSAEESTESTKEETSAEESAESKEDETSAEESTEPKEEETTVEETSAQ